MFWRRRKQEDFRAEVEAHIELEAERLECLLFSGYDPYFEGMNRQDCKGREEFDIVP